MQAQARRLQASLGVPDRNVVGDYLDSVREIERRVQMAEKSHSTELVIPDAPIGTPNDITEYFKLMFDLMALAFQADITRVITVSMDHEASMRTYTNLAISEGFHPLSHHGNNPEKMDKLVKIQNYHTQEFAGFIKKIEATKEADGTVLDHSTILFGSDMSNSDQPQQRSAALRDPGTRQRKDQRRPASEVSAGFAARRVAAYAAAAQ